MFEKEVLWIESLNNDESLFEKEVLKLNELYDIDDFNRIHDFLSKNRGVIVILNEVKPLLSEHAPYASLSLELDVDPLFVPQLLLMVKAPRNNFSNGFKDKIRLINSIIDPLVLYLQLHKEFFIWDDMIE